MYEKGVTLCEIAVNEDGPHTFVRNEVTGSDGRLRSIFEEQKKGRAAGNRGRFENWETRAESLKMLPTWYAERGGEAV